MPSIEFDTVFFSHFQFSCQFTSLLLHLSARFSVRLVLLTHSGESTFGFGMSGLLRFDALLYGCE